MSEPAETDARAAGPASPAAPARPRRILFWSDAYYTPEGGTEGQILQLIRGLPAGYEAELWVTHRSSWLASNPFPCPVRELDLGSLSSPSTWIRLRSIRRRIREGRFDLIQTYMCDAGILGPLVARKLGIPVIVARRDMGFWYTPKLLGAMRRTSRLAAGYVANSDAVRGLTIATEHVPADDVAVVRNGHDLASFDLPRDPATRGRLGIPADARLVGLLANFKPLKRHADLVDALERLATKHPRLHVAFYGGGESEEVMARAKAKGLADRVHLHFVVGGAVPALKELEIGVLCSESEGFSNAILEYMGCALPVVATGVGGNPELVEDSRTGILYEVGDVDALARALDALLSDPARAKALGAAGRARVEAEFSLAPMVAGTLAVYERALAGLPVNGGRSCRITGGGGGGLQVEVVTDRAALGTLSSEWRASLPANGFFAGPDWVQSWFETAAQGATPHVLVVRHARGEFAGLLALARRGSSLALPGASDGADHLDVVARPGDADAVADAVVDALAATRGRVIELRHLAEDGALRLAIRRRRWRLPYTERLATTCPFIEATGSFDDFLERFSAKHRGNLKRQVKQIREDPTHRLRKTASRDELAGDLAGLFDLHARSVGPGAGETSFAGPRIRAFHEALAARLLARGELALSTLELAGRAIAVHYGFRVGGKLYHFQGGYDPAMRSMSPGTSIRMMVLHCDVFEEGLREYDFLDGSEAYKRAESTGERRLYDVRLYRPTFLGRTKALVRGAFHLAARLVRRG